MNRMQKLRQRPMLPRAPPPPPPPPPPPIDVGDETRPENSLQGSFSSRRGILGMMIGGTVLWYAALNAGGPIVAVDKQHGVALLKTKGGNVVVATQDEAGRLFLFDKAGNIYYDTEDPRVGMYIVDVAGEMYNEYMDVESGEVRQAYVGNLKDVRSVRVREIGGIRMEELRKSVQGFKGGDVIGFPRAVSPEGSLSWDSVMPPNAPIGRNSRGDVVGVPPMLEDLEVDLEAKSSGSGSANRDILDIFKTLRRT